MPVLDRLIPAPKITHPRPGFFTPASPGPRLERDPLFQAEAHLLPGPADDQEAWAAAHARAFAAPLGREQGYVLDVTVERATIFSFTAQGLRNGAATFRQLSRNREGKGIPCCRIEDWPDIRFRASADWLLNAEVNLWGHERGDGIEATMARMKRKIDLAAEYKINVIWFDGFGWDADRAPWYAHYCGELSDYARRRHIRLAFGGYGGGYGFAYQNEPMYTMPYHGRVFKNYRNDSTGGAYEYECIGARHPLSRRCGTCLSNAELAAGKLRELTDFVRRCRPGMLWVHEWDAGRLDRARDGWNRRCSDCRKEWPSDEPSSPRGAAGAYAHWFSQVVHAVNAVSDSDHEYFAERDCEIVFVGPVYGDCNDTDDTWNGICDYFGVLSRCLGPTVNVEFGIREQVLMEATARPRVALLRDRLDSVGNGHGLLVASFIGGDKYFTDQLVPATAAIQGYWRGASTLYLPSYGSVAEPVMLINVNYAWTLDAPGAFPVAASRPEAKEVVRRCRAGIETHPGIFGTDGMLQRACAFLYGPEAGARMAEVFSLRAAEGVFPLAVAWRFAAGAMQDLKSGTGDPEQSARHWRARGNLTRKAHDRVAAALGHSLPDEETRRDLEWLAFRFKIGQDLCHALTLGWQWRTGRGADARAAFAAAAAGLRKRLRDGTIGESIDPVGGDLGVWRRIADELTVLTDGIPELRNG